MGRLFGLRARLSPNHRRGSFLPSWLLSSAATGTRPTLDFDFVNDRAFLDGAAQLSSTSALTATRTTANYAEWLVADTTERFNDGFPDAMTGWAGTVATVAASAGVATVTATGAAGTPAMSRTLTGLVGGRLYTVSASVEKISGRSNPTLQVSGIEASSVSQVNVGTAVVTTNSVRANYAGTLTVSVYEGTGSPAAGAAFRVSAFSVKDAAGWHAFNANTARRTDQGLLIEETRVNSIRNNSMQGAVAGSPGTVPTNWNTGTSGTGNGITRTIVGTGTEKGVDYIDIRYEGTTVGAATLVIAPEPNNQVAALAAQVWTASMFLALVGGSFTNITVSGSSPALAVKERDAAGAALVESNTVITGLTSALTRYSVTRTFTEATAAFAWPILQFTLGAGVAIDFTIRIGWPQLEQGLFVTSPIRTTTAAVTRGVESAYVPVAAPTFPFTMFAHANPGPLNTTRQLAAIDANGSGSDRFRLAMLNTGAVYGDGVMGGVLVGAVSGSAAAQPNTYCKTAVAFNTGDLAAVTNGGTAATSASTTGFPIGLNRFGFGASSAGGQPINSYLSRAALFPARLTNTELQLLTLLPFTWDFTTNTYADTSGKLALASSTANLTVTRSTGGVAEDTLGNWTNFAANTARRTDKGLILEEGRTNSIRNNSMQGAVVGGAGPTNWSTFPATTSGVTKSIVGLGTENGVEYVDVRIAGTSSNSTVTLFFDTNTAIAATNAQVWTDSAFLKLVSGTMPTGAMAFNRYEWNTGAFVRNSTQIVTPTSTLTRHSMVATIAGAATTHTNPGFLWAIPNGETVDFVVRIGWPQLELGAWATSPIRTTSGALGRSADLVMLGGLSISTPTTLFGQFVRMAPDSSAANEYIATLSDNTSNNRLAMFRPLSTTQVGQRSVSAGVSTAPANFASGSSTSGVRKKVILATEVGRMQGAYDGTLGTAGAPAAVPVGIDRLYLGANHAGGEIGNLLLEKVSLFSHVALPNTTQQTLTTP